MNAQEASSLANEYRKATHERAFDILTILTDNGWKALAELLRAERPALNDVKNTYSEPLIQLTREEAEALVKWMQHEWLGYESHGQEVNKVLKRLQKFVYSHKNLDTNRAGKE